MLGRSAYDPSQIAACASAFADALEGWQKVAARSDASARAEAEVRVFNQMVVALDGWFAHRLRRLEGKDGNVLNEVRLIALGLTANRGRFPADGVIRWHAETSVTGLRPGDQIMITAALFETLSLAFLAEMRAKFAT